MSALLTKGLPFLKVYDCLSEQFSIHNSITLYLIAFITSSLNYFLYNLRKGRGEIIEKGHTVILEWHDRVVDVIR